MKNLANHRSSGAARRDNWTFSTKWPARADRNRSRDRFQKRDASRDATLIGEDLLHCLGDTMPANGLGAIPRHKSNDQRADNRNRYHPQTEMAHRATWGGLGKGKLLIER